MIVKDSILSVNGWLLKNKAVLSVNGIMTLGKLFQWPKSYTQFLIISGCKKQSKHIEWVT